MLCGFRIAFTFCINSSAIAYALKERAYLSVYI